MCTQNLNLSSGTKGSSVAQSALSSRVDRNLVGRGLSRIDDKYFRTRKSVKVKIIDTIKYTQNWSLFSSKTGGKRCTIEISGIDPRSVRLLQRVIIVSAKKRLFDISFSPCTGAKQWKRLILETCTQNYGVHYSERKWRKTLLPPGVLCARED